MENFFHVLSCSIFVFKIDWLIHFKKNGKNTEKAAKGRMDKLDRDFLYTSNINSYSTEPLHNFSKRKKRADKTWFSKAISQKIKTV